MKDDATDSTDLYLGLMAAILFLAGAVMLFTSISSVIAFAVIGIGAALTIIASLDGRRRGGTAH